MTEDAIRLADVKRGDLPDGFGFDDSRVCYWRDEGGGWWIYLPRGGIGRLSTHNITEHEDGTITVSPSIGMSKSATAGFVRHGFLERGRWREC